MRPQDPRMTRGRHVVNRLAKAIGASRRLRDAITCLQVPCTLQGPSLQQKAIMRMFERHCLCRREQWPVQ